MLSHSLQTDDHCSVTTPTPKTDDPMQRSSARCRLHEPCPKRHRLPMKKALMLMLLIVSRALVLLHVFIGSGASTYRIVYFCMCLVRIRARADRKLVHAGAFTVQGTLGNNRSEKRHNNMLLAVCWENRQFRIGSGAGTSAHVNQC